MREPLIAANPLPPNARCCDSKSKVIPALEKGENCNVSVTSRNVCDVSSQPTCPAAHLAMQSTRDILVGDIYPDHSSRDTDVRG